MEKTIEYAFIHLNPKNKESFPILLKCSWINIDFGLVEIKGITNLESAIETIKMVSESYEAELSKEFTIIYPDYISESIDLEINKINIEKELKSYVFSTFWKYSRKIPGEIIEWIKMQSMK